MGISRFRSLGISLNFEKYKNFKTDLNFSPTSTITSTAVIESSNPSIIINATETGFKPSISLSDLNINVGTTGLTPSSVSYAFSNRITVSFSGTPAAGTLTIQAKQSAQNPPYFSNTNTLSFPLNSVTPTISTPSGFVVGNFAMSNVSIDVITSTSGYVFRTDLTTANFSINVGTTGLTASTVTRHSTNRVTINFTGTPSAGTITIQALTTAGIVASPSNSNTLSIVGQTIRGSSGYTVAGVGTASPNSGGIITVIATIEKLNFENDTHSIITTLMPSAITWSTGISSNNNGYVCGGFVSGGTSTIQKIAFSNDSRSQIGTTLSSIRDTAGGFSSHTNGYVCGGMGPSGVRVTTVDKIQFSNDSRTSLATGIETARNGLVGFASNSAGYVAGGISSANITSIVDKFVFSNDSRTILATGLSTPNYNASSFSSYSNGYVAGGGSPISTVDKFAFSNDSRTTLATGLSNAVNYPNGFENRTSENNNYTASNGYSNGGRPSGTFIPLFVTDKFNMSNDSRAIISNGLTLQRYESASLVKPHLVSGL
jgi:hypothetical protein